MHEDPRFAPPNAALRDVDAEREIAERPAQVRWASVLLWISFVLGAAMAVRELGAEREVAELAPAADAVVAGFTFGTLAFSGLLNVLIYQGRNWARVVYLVLASAALVVLVMPAEEGHAPTRVETVAYAVGSLLDFGAMVLVFTRPGALWFRRRR